jgi:hypothetical protein
MSFDGKAFGAEMTAIVKGYVDRATAPLEKRIAELEARPLPERGEKGDPGERGERGETGIGVKDALIDRSGVLVLTLSDGTRRDLGVIVGKDGSDGQNGADGAPGEPGKDGRDGFKLEDFSVECGTDGRSYVLKFETAEARHDYELTFPVPVYCGVFKAGEEYQPGDLVTWGGCLWHCDKATTGKPDSEDWTLAVKKGRDGKDAKAA